MSAPSTVAGEKPSRRVTLSRGASFGAAAAIAFLAFAANAAASPLYRVYQGQFRFSPTTLTFQSQTREHHHPTERVLLVDERLKVVETELAQSDLEHMPKG